MGCGVSLLGEGFWPNIFVEFLSRNDMFLHAKINGQNLIYPFFTSVLGGD